MGNKKKKTFLKSEELPDNKYKQTSSTIGDALEPSDNRNMLRRF